MAEIRIEHRYPRALVFLREHGPEAVAVLHDLLAHVDRCVEGLVVEATIREVVEATIREVAERLGLAKDTVHRRLRQLVRAGTLTPLHGSATVRSAYVINLHDTGISIATTTHEHPAT